LGSPKRDRAAGLLEKANDFFYLKKYAYLNSSRFEKAEDALQKFLTLEPNGTRAARAKRTLEDIEKIKK
jgi:TolA-binding protein